MTRPPTSLLVPLLAAGAAWCATADPSGALAAARLRALPASATAQEREALSFLYAGMPLSDLVDRDPGYFLAQVRASLDARARAPWGAGLPEELFRHFVLPPRVNNEHLDAFRTTLYRELLDRVKGLSMKEAALEINHWCHERVAYQASDIRTSAPLATLRTGHGRCGEESTFTVSALRAACIPARQVYTPRWAHCDDNHAWVEVWVDGGWHYLGACEPEPDLDLGWFREPARRIMLVHTRAYGPYEGTEPVVRRGRRFAELNLSAHYAPTKELEVRVVDRQGRAVPGAEVDFRMYNYGEFYALATRTCNASGRARLRTGLGDLLVWARHGEAFGFRRAAAADAAVEVVLDGDPDQERVLELDQVPPPAPPPLPLPGGDRTAHAARLKAEDAQRARRAAAFPGEAQARALAKELGLDGARVWTQVRRSTGNSAEVIAFLRGAEAPRRTWALGLLESLPDKDLRDTPASVLKDHLDHGLGRAQELPEAELLAHLLCPRVDNELLSPYRGALRRAFPKAFAARAKANPGLLADWTRRHIRLAEEANHMRVPLSPVGVWTHRLADAHSRDIFFVAACRSLDIPARLDPALRRPQYRAGEAWVDAGLRPRPRPGGEATARLRPTSTEGTLKYGTHFTLARLQAGRFETLDLGDDRPLSELATGLELPAGAYLAVTGTREGSGAVKARLDFFRLKAGEPRELPLVLRRGSAQGSLGRLGAEAGLQVGSRELPLSELAGREGALLLWAGPGEEPTRHLMGELKARQGDFGAWKGPILLVLPEGAEPEALGPDFQQLPGRVRVVRDPGRALLGRMGATAKRELGSLLPVLAAVDGEGELRALSEGYRIGALDLGLEALSTSREAK